MRLAASGAPVAVEPVNKVKNLSVHQTMDDVEYNISVIDF
jgi:hypothetical protein